jgi:hypothetical protein
MKYDYPSKEGVLLERKLSLLMDKWESKINKYNNFKADWKVGLFYFIRI